MRVLKRESVERLQTQIATQVQNWDLPVHIQGESHRNISSYFFLARQRLDPGRKWVVRDFFRVIVRYKRHLATSNRTVLVASHVIGLRDILIVRVFLIVCIVPTDSNGRSTARCHPTASYPQIWGYNSVKDDWSDL